MTDPPPQNKKSLELRQTWFLGLTALAVALMFAFVILPYMDPKAPALAGSPAEDFNLELISGGAPLDRVRLSDLRGKIVLLDFWASWCKPCRDQAKVLSEVSDQLGSDVYLLGISTSDRKDAAVAFVEAEKPSYPNAFDEDGQIGAQFRIMDLPTLLVVNAEGVIVSANSRVLEATEILQLVSTVRKSK